MNRVCIPLESPMWTFLYRKSVCYTATSAGVVFQMTYRRFKTKRCRTSVCNGILYANVEGVAIPVKELIAAIFLKDYDKSAPILMKDGNERNCHVNNLYQPLRRKGRYDMEQKKSMYTGVCVNCGAQMYVEAKSQKQANSDVSFGCNCDEGNKWRAEERIRRNREEVLQKVKKTVADLKKRLSDTYNIALPKETEENILQSSAKVYDGEYETTTIRRGNLNAKISKCKNYKFDVILDIKIAIAARFEI